MSKYYLTRKPDSDRGKFKVTICADFNDGDYLTNTDTYTKEQFDRMLDELIDLNFNYSGMHQLENFRDNLTNVPFDTQTGEPCHTLESLEIEYIDYDGGVWDVILDEPV